MNHSILNDIIKYYKTNYEKIGIQEIYKWEAEMHFQDNWDIENEDFVEMLKNSLSKTKNLMASGQYFPRRMILWIANKEPEFARKMFRNLFDLESDLESRINKFQDDANSVIVRNYDGKAIKSYQDHRAIMVYLSLMYPDKYFLYKYSMFKNFTELIDYSKQPKAGDIENVFLFEGLCNLLLAKIEEDDELLSLYTERFNNYHDPAYHLFVQDIIYAGQYYNRKSILDGDKFERIDSTIIKKEVISIKDFECIAKRRKISFKASKIDYSEQQKRNKTIGDLGEDFVFQYEKEKVKEYNLPKSKEVRWVSKVEGDGLGYDILSYNKDGDKIFIEVKATTGHENSNFYITDVELQKSEIDTNNYYLYRVYDFDKANFTGRISIKNGSLKDLCISPQVYKVYL